MPATPFLARFAEETTPLQNEGVYDEELQMLVERDPSGSLHQIYASRPTHIETATGGHNDTDTDAVED